MNCNWSCHQETLKSKPHDWFFGPCDFEVWQMTLKNNMAHLLCHSKLCASFHGHLWIQTGVTFWKCSIWVKIGDSSFVHHFVAICEFKSYGPAKFIFTSVILIFDLDLLLGHTYVNGNYSWKFHDDTMTGTIWKIGVWRTDKGMDGQMDRTIHGTA